MRRKRAPETHAFALCLVDPTCVLPGARRCCYWGSLNTPAGQQWAERASVTSRGLEHHLPLQGTGGHQQGVTRAPRDQVPGPKDDDDNVLWPHIDPTGTGSGSPCKSEAEIQEVCRVPSLPPTSHHLLHCKLQLSKGSGDTPELARPQI